VFKSARPASDQVSFHRT